MTWRIKPYLMKVRFYIHLYSLRKSSIEKNKKKQQQTTKQTGINAALTVISYHMTC